MSLAFQKLNGAGTQFQNLIDAVNLGNKSDLFKTAREFNPNKTLTPLAKTFNIPRNENSVNDLSLNGLLFGKWFITHLSYDVGDNDNARKRSLFRLSNGADVQKESVVMCHGDDTISWSTPYIEHYGYGTSIHLTKVDEADQQPIHSVSVSFIGYIVSDTISIPDPLPIPSGNVYFYGDSMAYGYNLPNPDLRFSKLLTDDWGLTERNYALAWQAIQNYSNPPNVAGFITRYLTDVPIHKPDDDYIFLAFGFNDFQFNGTLDLTIEKFTLEYSEILDKIITVKGWPAKSIVILSIFHQVNQGDSTPFQNVIKQLSLQYNTTYLNVFNNSLPLLPDGVHPNAEGHVYLYNKILSLFNPE